MIVMGIETSCDETSVSVVRDGRHVLSNVIASQTDIHSAFGGVVPEVAARQHIEVIGGIVDQALMDAAITLDDINGYAVANGPGLAGALLVGLNYAKALSYVNKKPLVGVHHIEGHVCANYLENEHLTPPFLCLVVSGGHTSILAVDNYDTYRVMGSTRDDAAGEAFDKIARIMGLPYPGGPQIDKLAKEGKSDAFVFPRAKVDGYDFSFSGLKTAVSQQIQKLDPENLPLADIAASFQQAVVDVLVGNTIKACGQLGYKTVALAGGVACNQGLRSTMKAICNEKGLQLYMPPPIYCTDNAAMVASRGYYRLKDGRSDGLNLNAYPTKAIGA